LSEETQIESNPLREKKKKEESERKKRSDKRIYTYTTSERDEESLDKIIRNGGDGSCMQNERKNGLEATTENIKEEMLLLFKCCSNSSRIE
jgi:hypothetical protein